MNCKQQYGIALITVLLILALASVSAVAMTTRQQLDIRRTTNILLIEQAYMVLQASEELAKRVLIADDNKTDSMNDIWKKISDQKNKLLTIGDFQVIEARLDDMHGRFNVNNLINASGDASAVNLQRFTRLLENYALPESFANTALDWIDSNQDIMPGGGAEDGDYISGVEAPYITPQRAMASASEMNRLLGVNLSFKQDAEGIQLTRRREIWKMIFEDKVLVALPTGTNINVNTVASPYMYRMIVPGMDDKKAQELFDQVQGGETAIAKPFETVAAFFQAAGVDGAKNNLNTQLGVQSEYFLFRAEGVNGQLKVYLNTILRRIGKGGGATVHVVHRSFGKWGEL